MPYLTIAISNETERRLEHLAKEMGFKAIKLVEDAADKAVLDVFKDRDDDPVQNEHWADDAQFRADLITGH